MPDSTNHRNNYKNFTYNICLEIRIWVGELESDTALQGDYVSVSPLDLFLSVPGPYINTHRYTHAHILYPSRHETC